MVVVTTSSKVVHVSELFSHEIRRLRFASTYSSVTIYMLIHAFRGSSSVMFVVRKADDCRSPSLMPEVHGEDLNLTPEISPALERYWDLEAVTQLSLVGPPLFVSRYGVLY